MWKKQIAWSQMNQWKIDGFVNQGQIFKLFEKIENFGRFWKFQGYGTSVFNNYRIINCRRFCTLQKERSQSHTSLENTVYNWTVYISSKVKKKSSLVKTYYIP